MDKEQILQNLETLVADLDREVTINKVRAVDHINTAAYKEALDNKNERLRLLANQILKNSTEFLKAYDELLDSNGYYIYELFEAEEKIDDLENNLKIYK